MVFIVVENKSFGRFPLTVDRKISVKGPLGETKIEIREGKVGIITSPCPNKMCVKFGKINHVGRVSVCLPNKVVIKIIGEVTVEDVDAVIG